jgi:hypothetical protein
MDALAILWGPGLVFIGLAVWLVRKAWKASRIERDLEEERLATALGFDRAALEAKRLAEVVGTEVAPPKLESVPAKAMGSRAGFRGSLAAADVSSCAPEHLEAIGALLDARARSGTSARPEVLWARSAGTHAVWCERRSPFPPGSPGPAREVLCIAQLRDGKVVRSWSHGE